MYLPKASGDVVLRYRRPGGAELAEPKVCKDAGDEVLVDMIESANQTISCQNFSFEILWEGIRSGEDCRMLLISEVTHPCFCKWSKVASLSQNFHVRLFPIFFRIEPLRPGKIHAKLTKQKSRQASNYRRIYAKPREALWGRLQKDDAWILLHKDSFFLGEFVFF